MHAKPLLLTLLFSLQTFVTPTLVKFYESNNEQCDGSPIDEYRIGCNQCVETAVNFNWPQIEVMEISNDQRFSVHSAAGCTPTSSIGQWYGAACVTAGTDPIRSVWVACPNEKISNDPTHLH